MKRFLVVLICFSLILQITTGLGQEVKAEDKWEGYTAISSKQELNSIREDTAGKYYLTEDIIFDETDFESGGEFYNGGNYWEMIESFSGILDGNGHTIKGLKMTGSAKLEQVGIIGTNDGEIKNLTFDGASIGTSNTYYCGIVAGINNGTIETVRITNSSVRLSNSADVVTGYVGAVSGKNCGSIRTGVVRDSIVRNSSQSPSVYAGGISGEQYQMEAEILDSYVLGGRVVCENTSGGASEQMTKSSSAGGICARNDGLIKRCYNTGSVSAIRPNYYGYVTDAGGISKSNGGRIEQCFNLGTITSETAQTKRKFGITGTASNIANSYYLYGTAESGCGQKDKVGCCETLTDEQMKKQICWEGFDFTEDWIIDTGSGINYPQLRRNRQAADSGIVVPDDKDYSGVPEGYIGIFDIEDLFGIRRDMSGKYILMNDIDMTEETAEGGIWNFANCGWKPLTDGSTDGFTGELEGNGYKIKGLNMRGSLSYEYAGLFEINSGVIKNIRFENVKMQYSNVGKECSGIVAGVNKGVIENVTLEDCVLTARSEYYLSTDHMVGGICGENIGKINKCVVKDCSIKNFVDTKGRDYCGGICGIQKNEKSEITNSYVLSGVVQSYNSGWSYGLNTEYSSSAFAYAGGITGYNYGTIRKCYNTGSVLANRAYSSARESDIRNALAGGIAGGQTSKKSSNIYECFNLGQVTVKAEYDYKISGIAPYGTGVVACYSLSGVLKKGDSVCKESVAACGTFLEKDISEKKSYPMFDFNGVWVIDKLSGVAYPQNCEFREVHVKSMELASLPKSVEFFQGDEIEPSGGKLQVSYVENTNTGVIDIEKYMLSGYDMNKLGKQTVLVSYDGKTCSYEINIKPVPVSSVRFEENELEINKGESQKLKAVILPLTATDKTLVWETSDERIVDVDVNGNVSAKAIGKATISACSTNGKRAECLVTVVSRATSVKLDVSELKINKGETRELIIKAFPEDTTDAFIWETSNEEVVVVDKDGKLVARGRGKAQITVTASSGVSAVCDVEVVVPASEIQVSEKAITLLQEKTTLVSATMLPEDSTDNYNWLSADDEIASVTSDGTITAHKPGVVEIMAVAESGVKDIVEVTVLPAYHVTGIQFRDSEIVLEKDETITLGTEITPVNYTDDIYYGVDNENIAVIEGGKIKGVSTGTTYVNIVSSNGVSARCKVRVIISAQSVTMNMDDAIMSIGEHLKLSAELYPKDTTDTITWSSEDEQIAQIDEEGNVLAVDSGECNVYATSDSGKKAQCKIRVIESKVIDSLDDWLALSSVKGDVKYLLNADLKVGSKAINLSENTSLFLDLNGHTIEGTDTIIKNSGNLTINDTSDEKNGYIRSKVTDSDIVIKYCVVNTGSLYINGGNIQADVTVEGMPSSPWAVGLRNAGYVQISGGNLKADSVCKATTLGWNKAYGILNHEDGVVDMLGGNISVNTVTIANDTKTECNTYSYGIYNNTSNTVSISGGVISCTHREEAEGKKNAVISAGLYNNGIGKIQMTGGEVRVTNEESTDNLKGSMLGISNGGDDKNVSKGKIEVIKGKIKVEAISEQLLVVGLMNLNGGEIIVGSDKSVGKEEIGITSYKPNNKDYIITNENGKIEVHRGVFEGGYGIVSNVDYMIGEGDGIVSADDLSLKTQRLLFIGKGKITINDGRYKGPWDIREESVNTVDIYAPHGYTMSNASTEYVDNGELVPIQYDITYWLDGGINNALNPDAYDITMPQIELQSPSKEGYRFEGWYEDVRFVKKVTQIVGTECENKTLYAKWQKISSDVDHSNDNSGTSSGDTSGTDVIQQTPKPQTTGTPIYPPEDTKKGADTIPKTPEEREVDEEEASEYEDVDEEENAVTIPIKIKKIKVKRLKKNSIKVSFSKVFGVSAYEIKYGINKKFKKAKSKTTKKNTVKIKSLKKNKVYYVKVRAYKFYEGKKIYGKWSNVKKIKVK